MTCKDCIHYDVCKDRYEEQFPYGGLGFGDENEGAETFCKWGEGFKYKSRYIELPCKVGDTVWIADKERNYVEKYTVSGMDMYDNGNAVITEVRLYNYFALIKSRGYTSDYFGKQIFLTSEEAEKALKERCKDDI